MEKFIFTMDNESQYFVSENHVIYWKNDFQKFFDVEKMFSQQGEGVSNFTPPSRVAEKTSKSSQNFTYWFFDKNSKIGHYTEKIDFFKIFEKNVPMGILTKISQNLLDV